MYKTKGTCSQEILFDLRDGKVHDVQFISGCHGNTQGVAALVEGMDVDEAGFAEMMDQQRKRAREARAALGDFGWDGEAETELSQIEETVFLVDL